MDVQTVYVAMIPLDG